ncbi:MULTISPECIES: hypothetical protein [unclassified Microcoleus]|uniref:hypothetical protein n=1 Tax=unclassified Microcoleus TaxID=2642155 RepID=UPI002FD6D7F1
MARLNHILVVSAVTVLALTGCDSAKQASTPKTSPSEVPAATAVSTSDKAASPVSYAELVSVVTNTKAAVQTGNFAKAKTEFDKFENSWKKVEDGIKKRDPKSYDAVEETTEKVMTELKKSKPSKDQVLAELQSLEKTISSIPKS